MGRFFSVPMKPANMPKHPVSRPTLISSAAYMLVLGVSLQCNHAHALNTVVGDADTSTEIQEDQKRTSKSVVAKHASHLRSAMINLYRLNPQELQKSASVSAEEMTQWVFEGPFGWKFDALREAQGIDALRMAFDPEFRGDRILAMTTGMQTMIINAYGGKTEFLFPDPINPQRLNMAAHNINTILSRLENADNNNLIESFTNGIVTDENILSTLSSIQKDLELDAKEFAINHREAVVMDAVSFETTDFLPFHGNTP